MARSGALLSSLLLLLMASVAASFTATSAFATLPARIPLSTATRLLPSLQHAYPTPVATSSSSSPPLYLTQNDEDSEIPSTGDTTIYTPLDRPLLAIIDIISLTIFAATGKSSHSADGSLDLIGVLTTAFPFISAWLATSPLTGIYSPDDQDNNVSVSTALKVGKGWILAIPIGIALRTT